MSFQSNGTGRCEGMRMGLVGNTQFFSVLNEGKCPPLMQWVMRQIRPCSRYGAPVQHWPRPGGTHASAAPKEADAVTSATAKSGTEMVEVIIVPPIGLSGWPRVAFCRALDAAAA